MGFSLVVVVIRTSLLLAHPVNTQLIDDPNGMSVIKGAPRFRSCCMGLGLLESNPYQVSNLVFNATNILGQMLVIYRLSSQDTLI